MVTALPNARGHELPKVHAVIKPKEVKKIKFFCFLLRKETAKVASLVPKVTIWQLWIEAQKRKRTLTVVSLRNEKMPTKFPPPPTPPPSLPNEEEEDHHHELEGVAAVTYRIVLPTISVLGLAGNLLSILGNYDRNPKKPLHFRMVNACYSN